jgi:transcriptional regulator with XRE-family HTH domain
MFCQFIEPLVSPQRYLKSSLEHRCSDLDFQSGKDNRLMSTMGQRLKALRLSKRLTQVQLAERVGVKQNTISDLERGDSQEMKAETLRALCKELVTTSTYLLDGVPNGDAHEEQLQEAELTAIFRELPPQAQQALVNSARLLREAIPTNSPAQPIIKARKVKA